jgi:hypothetical protein
MSTVFSPTESRAAASIAFKSFGASITVQVEPEDLMDRLRELLPPGAVETDLSRADASYSITRVYSRSGDCYNVLRESTVLTKRAPLTKALLVLSNSLHFAVARHAHNVLFLHSGVIAWGGRALLLPGSSRAGKSTLVEALVRQGATYLSDECAPLTSDARVHPYRKPIWLRSDHPRAGLHPFRGNAPAAEVTPTYPVASILFTKFRAGSVWEPQKLMPGQALLGLVASAVVAATQPEPTLSCLTRLVASASAYTTERDDAEAIAERALRLLDQERAALTCNYSLEKEVDLVTELGDSLCTR